MVMSFLKSYHFSVDFSPFFVNRVKDLVKQLETTELIRGQVIPGM